MKPTITTKLYLIACGLFLATQGLFAQSVGINTDTPQGILDINSSTAGFVLPRVALQSTILETPVVNPQGGALAVGTTVYNTNTSSLGVNDVSPGIYAWNGTSWNLEFTRNQSELYESLLFIRTNSSAGFQNIGGLTSQTFTPEFTGTYRIKVDVNYGGYSARVPDGSSQGNLNVARASGTFRFTMDGTDYDIPAHAFSTAYNSSIGATNYFAIWQEFSTVLYNSFTATNSISFNLSFDQDPLPDFINNGISGNGRGIVSYDIPCTVEFIYVGD